MQLLSILERHLDTLQISCVDDRCVFVLKNTMQTERFLRYGFVFARFETDQYWHGL